jgi:hypothetical protein
MEDSTGPRAWSYEKKILGCEKTSESQKIINLPFMPVRSEKLSI